LFLPLVASPAGILSAGVYQQNGLAGLLFLLSGLLFVAVLARQLSLIAESSRQKTRQLEKLEELGRAIIQSPPDASVLSEILAEHVTPMFPSSRIAIWMVPDRFLLLHPADWAPTVDRFWAWMRDQTGPRALQAKDEIPWARDESSHPPVIVTPIFAIETLKPLGGIYIELQDILQLWDARALESLLPAVQSLAALIASTLREANLYSELLDHQRVMQELRLAGQIQASFLPNEFPIPAGWEVAVTILPARETSGDYFDFIPLTDGRLGILIADVADKGVGPALYMALSRTLIRTYAREFSLDPEVVFYAANGRILEDARANLFVTAFYAVLDPGHGTLTYSNAGHNPPFLISARDGGGVHPLDLPGIPIGIEAEAVWKKSTVQMAAGDMLVLYTDGIPDAQNSEGELFGEGRLIQMARTCLGIPAQEAQANIINALQRFVGEAPQVDDITLMILARGEEPGE
jgi:serine phosphatase RsbU (regulator of sigma subunit)